MATLDEIDELYYKELQALSDKHLKMQLQLIWDSNSFPQALRDLDMWKIFDRIDYDPEDDPEEVRILLNDLDNYYISLYLNPNDCKIKNIKLLKILWCPYYTNEDNKERVACPISKENCNGYCDAEKITYDYQRNMLEKCHAIALCWSDPVETDEFNSDFKDNVDQIKMIGDHITRRRQLHL